MEYDATTDDYYDRARYYSATTGHFVLLDPEGFAAGDTDLYRYSANEPTDSMDFSGLVGEPQNQQQGQQEQDNEQQQQEIQRKAYDATVRQQLLQSFKSSWITGERYFSSLTRR